ncbi:MAG TPA: hypothetical protein VH951_03760 [Dehalococcoidia bacterium]
MTTEAKPTNVKRPENLDLEKARVIVAAILKENKEWLKEMADK